MPLPGGSSDKYGNRFEGKWTVYCIAQVMAEEADSIRLEPVGADGDGAEFILRIGPVVEYHQVKRQHARLGDWTIAELAGKGVLHHAFIKTRDPSGRYIFISTTHCAILEKIVDDAKRAESLSEFKEYFLKGEKVKAWANLLRQWHDLIQEEMATTPTALPEDIQSAHEHIAYEHVKRIEIRNFDEKSLTEMVETKLRTMVQVTIVLIPCGNTSVRDWIICVVGN